jgi:membrane fusion protein, heavy metal efflux system
MKTNPLAWLPLAGILLCSCGSAPPPPTQSPAPADASKSGVIEIAADSPKLKQIQVAEVRLEELPTDEFTAPGKIEINPNRVSKVLLPVAGRIAEVLVRFGDAVRKDQTLVLMESPEAESAASAYLQAEGDVAQAASALHKAQSDLDRVQDLFKGDAIAKKEVIAAETTVAQAKTAQKQSQNSFEQAKVRLEMLGLKPGTFRQKIAVRAPLSGKITEITAVAGEYRNDLSASLMTIADLSTVWVSADVPESAIRLVQVGERFDVTLSAFPSEVLHSRVARIADSVDPQTRAIKVWAELNNSSGRLRPEMFGEVRHIESLHRVPAVPATAVVQSQQRSIVYREVAKGKFQQTEVELGKRSGNLIPVLRGINAGDRVVVAGAMLLRGY